MSFNLLRMADVHDKKTRSYNMSRIRGKDTKPEMLVRRYLHQSGFRYRLHAKYLPGKPDIILPKYRTVIFVNGCFWHGHENCTHWRIPKTRTGWWKEKIKKRRALDTQHYAQLESENWRDLLIWECDLKPERRGKTLYQLIKDLTDDDLDVSLF
ncbi:MAG: DNA mismatch endonuclease Vsr [Bacteroidota bacterium]